jgi:hypothetical protein
MDLIIVFTDQDGEPVLPDKEKRNARNDQAARINNNELTYTFNSPSQPWSASQLTALNTYVNDFYPVIKSIIGSPLFNITLNVRLDVNISYAGLYFPSMNEMVLAGLNEDAFCHESIHAFRDDYVMELSTYEEGMTRAAEVEVFNRLENYMHDYDEFHSYSYDYFYEALNRPNIGSAGGSVFSNMTLQLLRYQVSSYVWAKAYLEDNRFLERFNDSLYSRTVVDPSTRYTESKLRNIFETIKPVVEGIPNQLWYNMQHILHATPSAGYKLYQRINQYTIDYFYRATGGGETPQGGVILSWEVFDYNNTLINSGNGVSSPGYGFLSFNPGIPANYNGRIKIVASVESPAGLITDTVYRTKQPIDDQGIFGLVKESNTGTITITPLDTVMAPVTANLINGAFSFPALENVRGRFRVVFTYPDASHVTRIYTKDRSKYFLSISKELAEIPIVTPVLFSSFDIKCIDGKTLLKWSTATEINSSHFDIQKKLNNNDWTTIDRVAAAGNSNLIKNYIYTDVGGGEVFYRIRQADFDGKFEYTIVKRVNCSTSPANVVIYPVPARDMLTIVTRTNKAIRTVLQIIDMAGRVVKEQAISLNPGYNNTDINIADLTPGDYIIKSNNSSLQFNNKFMIVR